MVFSFSPYSSLYLVRKEQFVLIFYQKEYTVVISPVKIHLPPPLRLEVGDFFGKFR